MTRAASVSPALRMVCVACGAEPDPPYRCPNAGRDDGDHLLGRQLRGAPPLPLDDDEPSPFVRYRRSLMSYQTWREAGADDASYVEIVRALEASIAEVDGAPPRDTPLGCATALARALGVGQVWIKNETGNVAGSHKARHLIGLMLYLQVAARLGRLGEPWPPLAIASCGNAALAAAVVARAAGRALRVFIPVDANPEVVDRLGQLGAELVRCPRVAGEPGDPCYHRFRAAVQAGALPFSVQGNENGLAIEGGMTLGHELVAQLTAAGATVDSIVIQVGGGALASATIQSLRQAVALGLLQRLPRIHTVQTTGAAPLARAHRRLLERLATAGVDVDDPLQLAAPAMAGARAEALSYAAQHRSEFMWPWEHEPRSIAHGILDDETYDWHAICAGMLDSGGEPLIVDEPTLEKAFRIASEVCGIDADPTGAAGLAGIFRLSEEKRIGARDRVALLFTGARRAP